jgi:site-specific recombinase XerD
MTVDIYKLNISSRLESVEHFLTSDRNKELILNFVDYCFSEGLGEHRILKYITTLKYIAQSFQIDFEAATETDVRRYVSELERSSQSQWTKHDYKVVLKKFYRWLNGGQEPSIVKWINTSFKDKDQKLPEEMISESEVKLMIDSAENKRDKALIALLWDIGARISEIGNLNVKDIKFDDVGISILVNGKTGPRKVRAVWSIDYLNDWLKVHPGQNNPEAPLWFNFAKKIVKLEAMQYGAIRMQLTKISRKAGISKKIHPHLFRHSRCTYMAKYLTEAQMDAYFGWIQGSDMPSIYVHLSGRDIDDAVLKANGITNKSVTQSNIERGIESPKMDLSSMLEAKVNKLVEAKITELLGNSL